METTMKSIKVHPSSNKISFKVAIPLNKIQINIIDAGNTINSKFTSEESNKVERLNQELYNSSRNDVNSSKCIINNYINEEFSSYENTKKLKIDDKNAKHSDYLSESGGEEYEPTPDMFAYGPNLMNYVEEMSFCLHLLVQADNHIFNVKGVFENELNPVLRNLAKRNYLKVKKNFIETTKDIGEQFLLTFNKMYTYYGEPRCLMLIFVEVIKSQMRRAKVDIKRPNSKRIQILRNLMYGMLKTNGCNEFDGFFVKFKGFEELFIKAYSSSFVKHFESPSHQFTPSASPSEPSTSRPEMMNNKRRLVYLEPPKPDSSSNNSPWEPPASL